MESKHKDLILLTGSTGFIGAHVAMVFAERCLGEFRLRIALRDLQSSRHLKFRDLLGEEAFNQIEFVEMELSNQEQINNACQGAKYIIHSAGYSIGDRSISEQE